jgi:MFS family permease
MKKDKASNLLRRTFRISTLEGIFAQVYGTFSMIGSSFIVKLMVLLNASPLHYSLLSSIGQLSQVFQPIGVVVTHKLINRKKACVLITFWGRFLTLFLGVGLLFSNPYTGIWFTLILLFLSSALLSIGANIWIAWVSDLVPITYRGRFFSRRNQFLLAAGLVAGYLGSFAVDLFSPQKKSVYMSIIDFTGWGEYFNPGNQGRFLTALFVFSTLIGLIGLAVLSRQPEKKKSVSNETLSSIYLQPLKDKNFRKLLIFAMWWMLAIGIGSAFWTPFMLKKLQMSLFEVQVYGSLHMLSSFFAYRFWGRFIDKNGNKTAMTICIVLGGFNPMLWLFMRPDAHSVIWFEALVSGFMWAGNGIVSTNFVLSVSPKGNEQVYSGIYGALGGISMMCSTLLSGVFFPVSWDIRKLHLESEQVLFGIGGVMRWTALIPLAFIREKRSRSLRQLSQLVLNNLSNWKSRF